MRVTRRRIGLLIAIFGVIVATAFAFRPRPVAVEAVRAARGPLMVSIDEQGITRVRERYMISAPVPVRHTRIDVHAGDSVERGTVLVRLDPLPLDARTVAGLSARLESAERSASEAEATARRAQAVHAQAVRDHQRLMRLSNEGIAAREAAEQAHTNELQLARDADAARYRAQAARFDVDVARAALLAAEPDSSAPHSIVIRAPIAGRVLRVQQENEGVVAAGTPLLDLGDIETLEAVIDVLSSDAVRIRPGAPVIFEHWGGDQPLAGGVRLVEPAAFTKVSALGVDEQRVNVIADFVERPARLGDAYRLDARIILWRGEALKVPTTSLFRDGDQWSLFVVDGKRARTRRVRIGQASVNETAILSGISPADRVITHPSDQLRDGVRVAVTEP